MVEDAGTEAEETDTIPDKETNEGIKKGVESDRKIKVFNQDNLDVPKVKNSPDHA